jgi:hypothetical protein
VRHTGLGVTDSVGVVTHNVAFGVTLSCLSRAHTHHTHTHALTTTIQLLCKTESFVGDLVENVNLFKCNAYCTFVKDTYDDLTVAMCKTLLGE